MRLNFLFNVGLFKSGKNIKIYVKFEIAFGARPLRNVKRQRIYIKYVI